MRRWRPCSVNVRGRITPLQKGANINAACAFRASALAGLVYPPPQFRSRSWCPLRALACFQGELTYGNTLVSFLVLLSIPPRTRSDNDPTDYSLVYNWLADRFEDTEPIGDGATALGPNGERRLRNPPRRYEGLFTA